MATSYATLRDAIVTVVEAAHPDVGTIHNRYRYAADWPRFLNLMATRLESGEVRIRGWMLTRTDIAYAEDDSSFGSSGNYRVENFKLRGFYGFNDEGDTDTAFQEMVDVLVTALDGAAGELGADPNYVAHSQGVVKVQIDLRTFGGTFCHYAELDYSLARKGA